MKVHVQGAERPERELDRGTNARADFALDEKDWKGNNLHGSG